MKYLSLVNNSYSKAIKTTQLTEKQIHFSIYFKMVHYSLHIKHFCRLLVRKVEYVYSTYFVGIVVSSIESTTLGLLNVNAVPVTQS
jgi:hypothetical protein